MSLFFSGSLVYSSDSLHISIYNKRFIKEVTLEFQCSIPDYAGLKLSSATINVWIEDIHRSHRWKFRYPIVNGEDSASLASSDKVRDGRYAVNFLVQKGFFKVLGQVQNHEKKIPGLTIEKNENGQDVAKWRNEVAELYVDGFNRPHIYFSHRNSYDQSIPPTGTNIRFLRRCRGNCYLYQKGAFANNSKFSHNFIVKGYTKVESVGVRQFWNFGIGKF